MGQIFFPLTPALPEGEGRGGNDGSTAPSVAYPNTNDGLTLQRSNDFSTEESLLLSV